MLQDGENEDKDENEICVDRPALLDGWQPAYLVEREDTFKYRFDVGSAHLILAGLYLITRQRRM